MKRTFGLFLVFISSLILTSCEEDFNPFSEKKNVFILNSILRNDTTYQTLTLSASYQPDGYDPYTVTNDPVIKGADVRIWVNDSVFVFRDSTIKRPDTSRYKDDLYFYYHKSINLYPNSDIEVEVILSDGKKLTAKSKTPQRLSFSSMSSTVISESIEDFVKIIWTSYSSDKYFLPRMTFSYYKLINGVQTRFIKTVPVRYLIVDGNSTPVFPQPGYSNQLFVHKSVLGKALEEISENDPNKESYSINEFVYVDVLSFDNALTRYYSSTLVKDNLTISVDENDFTNVDGGLGIFASYNKDSYRLKFFSAYVTSLGYKFNYGQ